MTVVQREISGVTSERCGNHRAAFESEFSPAGAGVFYKCTATVLFGCTAHLVAAMAFSDT